MFELMGNHWALTGTIRVTGLVVALAFGAMTLFTGAMFVMALMGVALDSSLWKVSATGFVLVLISLTMMFFTGALSVVGFQMARTINRTSVDNFSILVAILFGRLCYKLYPPGWVGTLSGYEVGAGFMGFVMFLLTYSVLKFLLCRWLKLN